MNSVGAAGGSEFRGETIDEYTKKDKEEQVQYRLPFGGGSGAGVTINPIAFLVIQSDNVKLMPVNYSSSLDKLLDYIPDLMEKTNNMMNKAIQNKKEETDKIIKNMQNRHNKSMQKNKKNVEEKSQENTKNEKEDLEENNNTYEFDYEDNLEDE